MLLRNEVKSIPNKPGIYKFFDNKKIIYVGKAKNLKKRVTSYSSSKKISNRQISMISSVNRIEITITRTEVEALLLEANLIKNIQPKFNIRLKDDKSYAYVLLKSNHNFPQISKFRGKKNNDGFYFGPFPFF